MRVYKPVFAKGLQRAIVLLRKSCFLKDPVKFPELVGPVEFVMEEHKKRSKEMDGTYGDYVYFKVLRFIVKINIESKSEPWFLWLKFDIRGQSVYVSQDKEYWLCINIW